MFDDVQVPIIVGVSRTKFWLPLSGDVDNGLDWNLPFTKYNPHNYPHELFSRVSMNFDINIRPFSLIVGFAGALIIPSLKE